MASNTFEALPPTLAVTTRMAHGVFFMIVQVACTPSITGMMRSIRIRSGQSRAHFSTASAPSAAVHATS